MVEAVKFRMDPLKPNLRYIQPTSPTVTMMCSELTHSMLTSIMIHYSIGETDTES